jgi:ferredoxin
MEIRIVCAWCGREELEAGKWEHVVRPWPRESISHGICPPCARACREDARRFERQRAAAPAWEVVHVDLPRSK